MLGSDTKRDPWCTVVICIRKSFERCSSALSGDQGDASISARHSVQDQIGSSSKTAATDTRCLDPQAWLVWVSQGSRRYRKPRGFGVDDIRSRTTPAWRYMCRPLIGSSLRPCQIESSSPSAPANSWGAA
jgi:hypothetical protein